MSLDAYVRCTCIRDGKAKPHPFPHKFALDEFAEPALIGNASLDEWIAHDRWFADSCEHMGYLVSERLGNVAMIAKLREFIQTLDRESGLRFPILLGNVVYSGTHSGDSISRNTAKRLQEEVDNILGLNRPLRDWEREFLGSLKRLCDASIATGNPITF